MIFIVLAENYLFANELLIDKFMSMILNTFHIKKTMLNVDNDIKPININSYFGLILWHFIEASAIKRTSKLYRKDLALYHHHHRRYRYGCCHCIRITHCKHWRSLLDVLWAHYSRTFILFAFFAFLSSAFPFQSIFA